MEDPGTRYRYSESPTVLGRLVEIWSGKPFDVFLTERVFQPLGMTDTVFWVAPDRPRAARHRLHAGAGRRPHGSRDRSGAVHRAPRAASRARSGSCRPSRTYLRFSQMLLNKGELDGVPAPARGDSREDDRQRAAGCDRSRRAAAAWDGDSRTSTSCLNPAALNYPANRGEYGWDGSAGTIFWIDPGLEMVTILMTQSSPANPDALRQRFKTLVQQSVVN